MEQMLIADDLDYGEDCLAHYGVQGMKWGVWNSETRARYSRAARKGFKASGQMVVKGAKAVHAKSSARRSAAKARRADKRRRAHERRKQRRELGMDPIKYEKLRKQTLRSHDPEVIARGMHTLTDEELGAKIRRLQQEDVVAKMATSRAQDRHRTHQARNQALAANPIYRLGESYVKKLGDRSLDYLMPKPNKNNKSKKNADNQNNSTKQHSSNDNKGEKSKKDKKGKKNKDTARSFVESAENNTISDKRINSGYKYVSNVDMNALDLNSFDKSRNYK